MKRLLGLLAAFLFASTLAHAGGVSGTQGTLDVTIVGCSNGAASTISLSCVPGSGGGGAVTNAGTFAVQVTSAPTTAVTGTFWQATQPVSGTFWQTTQPVSVAAVTHGQTAALASNVVLKASAGTLYSFNATADSTLSGAAWWVMIFDATTLPSDGAVTPAKCFEAASAQNNLGGTFDTGGVAFATGIVIGVSTTGCFTKTASAHAFISGDFQ